MGLGFGLGASLLGQGFSPFHLLTHEFSQAFGLAGGPVVYVLGWAIGRKLRDRDQLALHVTLAAGLVQGTAAFLGQTLANAVAHDCRNGSAIAFFWITWAPLVALFAVLGVAIGERGWSLRRGIALLVGLGAAALAHDLLQLVLGVRVSDPLLGEPLFLDQRAQMEVTPEQIAQRLWLVGLAVAVWQVRSWWRKRGPASALRAVLTAGTLAAVTLGAGSEIGVGWGQGAIRARLSGVHRTKHFRVRYNSAGEGSLRTAAIGRDAEWQWHALTTAWGIDPDHLVEIRVFDDEDQMRRLTGIASPHAGFRRIDLPWWGATARTLRHELAHVLHPELSWRPELLLLRGHTEGLAVAWADGLVSLPAAHARQAAALAAGLLPSAQEFMSPTGFFTVNESNAYDAAGSFIGWLVLEHGFDMFLRLQRELDFEAVYGRDLGTLETEWRRFLATVPVSLAQRAEARESFDPEIAPSYQDLSCPKLGRRRQPEQERAERLFRAGDYAGSLASYTSLYNEDNRLGSLTSAAACLQELGRHSEALALLEQAQEDSLEVDQRHDLLQARVRSLVARCDWEALDLAWAARRDLGTPTVDQEQIEQCLRDVDLREAVAQALTLGEVAEGQEILRGLSRRYPERRCIQYLAATRGYPIPQSRWSLSVKAADRTRIDAAFDALNRAPEACDQLAARLRTVVERSIDVEAWNIAERGVALMQRACTSPLDGWWAAQAAERISWERRGTEQR